MKVEEIGNPWKELKEPDYYFQEDKEQIDEFNKTLGPHPYFIDMNLLPEPWIGNKEANVILLFTNPGLKGNEADNYQNKEYGKEFKEALCKNLIHGNKEYPYYYLNPKFKKTDGAVWLKQRLTDLVAELYNLDKDRVWEQLSDEDLQLLSQKLFTLQLHPYHSAAYKKLKKQFKSHSYTMQLLDNAVEKAKQGKAIIICVRSYKEWNSCYKEYKKINSKVDYLRKESEPNFIELKYPSSDKTPRTPYFKRSYFKDQDFEELLKKLKDPINIIS